MQFALLTDRMNGPGCGFENAGRVRSAGVQLGGLLTLSCPMALTFAMWEDICCSRPCKSILANPLRRFSI